MQEETKEVTLDTPITKLNFPQAPRLRKTIAKYNATLDKEHRLITVADLKKFAVTRFNTITPDAVKALKGIGKTTAANLLLFFKQHGL